MTGRINLVAILLLLISAYCQADMTTANAARARGDYETAVAEYTRLADSGNDVAQATLAYLYHMGEGVDQDLNIALDWYHKAANQGNPDAQYNLAVAYAFGEGVTQDYTMAVQWYTLAAPQEHAIAQYSLALSYDHGEGVAQNPETAVYWLTRSAENGYARAQVLLGSKYHTGDGIALDLAKAARWYRLAAEQQDPIAQFNLAGLYRSGTGVGQDLNEALSLYEMSAGQGYKAATEELAKTRGLLTGTNNGAVATNTPDAMEGSTDSPQDTGAPGLMTMDNLASSLLDPAIIDDAAESGARADAAGSAAAMGAQDETAAGMPDTEPGSANDGMAIATPETMIADPGQEEVSEIDFNTLSGIYQGGMERLAQQNYTGAISLFRSAAAQGDPMAQYQIGSLYHQGRGLGLDYNQAALWYRRAAEQGNVDAQFSLGNMYLMGEGIPQNDTEARYWYEQAALQGHTGAGHNLMSLERFAPINKTISPTAPQDETKVNRDTNIHTAANMGPAQGQALTNSSPEAAPSSIATVDYERGLAYSFGEGVPRDQARAFNYYQRAAEQNHAAAQYRLGIAYAYGEGTDQDKAQALQWYRKAAMQGHRIAQRNLAIMYQNGDGIARDKPMALAWLSILADYGNVMDQRRRDMLVVELDSGQLARAEKLKSELFRQILPAKN